MTTGKAQNAGAGGVGRQGGDTRLLRMSMKGKGGKEVEDRVRRTCWPFWVRAGSMEGSSSGHGAELELTSIRVLPSKYEEERSKKVEKVCKA